MGQTGNIVELQQVGKKYSEIRALQSLDLYLKAGEVFGLFGHNGAGKTTIIKLILGLIGASSGRISVFGKDPAQQGGVNFEVNWDSYRRMSASMLNLRVWKSWNILLS
ncbi:ATP-binding cassette domain-containing protein [Microbulbifer sp. VAAF005]|uniref:ATP-binding cassette domain-containing protein n=1 Tax=Microbulbifer sp. VAAF005 TaxID=3034230 RepID=UPI0024AE3D20|nr:ATP-binding cassette domain-containing protein [Microbulbifer sp. VAAF005]WHI47482.1 ATP-binding cassette domain-containing protein [Microbulbifer sp. VAAF005]